MQLNSLSLVDLQELARLKAEFETAAEAKPVLEFLLRQPGGPFPRAAYSLGCILLDEGDQRGLQYLTIAARSNRHLTNDALHASTTPSCARPMTTATPSNGATKSSNAWPPRPLAAQGARAHQAPLPLTWGTTIPASASRP
ncbi:hypothetical protein LP420_15335 [Massilia sp. B-10]|nr:hypothetical protein LP420_15335 [Massilia sp. B-10]